MSLSDDISVTALVISLIALGLGVGSLLAQLFATAEGYRKCEQMVIGPWANHTRRHWLGFEFRFEVLYVTPEIVLLTKHQMEEMKNTKQLAAVHLTDIKPGMTAKLNPDGLFKRLRQGFRAQESYEDNVKALEECLRPNLLTTNEGLLKTPTRAANILATLKRTAASINHPLEHHFSEKSSSSSDSSKIYMADTGLLVSWVPLLREMHRLYMFSLCNMGLDGVSKDEKACAEPAVIYRRRSWDLVPPDVVRPLAQTSVGTIVVLATRYGMKWKVLERQRGEITMVADGNGYVLSSVYVRGMGLVISFLRSSASTSWTNIDTPLPNFIPTRFTDMMMCGILPGDPSLIDHKFRLMGDDYKLRPNELLEYLVINQYTRDQDSLPLYNQLTGKFSLFDFPFQRTGFNDLIILIPPFLPITLSTNTTAQKPEAGDSYYGLPQVAVRFSGFLGQNMYSIFTYVEGRMALLHGISDLVRNPNESVVGDLSMKPKHGNGDCELRTPDNTSLDWIYFSFKEFEEQAAADFFQAVHPKKSGIWSGVTENQRIGTCRDQRTKLVTFCRKVHAHTTRYFECFQNAARKDQKSGEEVSWGRIPFTAFLRAHSKLAENAGLDVRDHEKYQKDLPEWKDYYEDERKQAGNYTFLSMRETLWKIGNEYVVAVNEDKFHKHLRFDGAKITVADAKIAWWMLMLRGIAWTMSVFIETKNEVPSSFYEDPTPVWIT